jgi:uncharacterized damage-inducible protein DinB
MAAPLTATQLLGNLRSGRAAWDALISRIPPERMTQPGVEGAWSVKDIIAHIAWHEREMIGVLQARALVGSPWWELSTDARNAAIYAEIRDGALADVIAEENQVFTALLARLETLTNADVADPSRYREMPADWVPGDLFAQNTYEHYAQHIPAIRAWLAAQG